MRHGGLSGKHLLYMDVRSLATGRLLATWTLGVLKPAEEPHDVTILERQKLWRMRTALA
jgi:hypothetical protein